jgi:hypothetical protein
MSVLGGKLTLYFAVCTQSKEQKADGLPEGETSDDGDQKRDVLILADHRRGDERKHRSDADGNQLDKQSGHALNLQ